MNPKPTIGRIVHAYGRELSSAFTENPIYEGPEAAIIVGLHEEEGLVDLTVFQSNGIFQQRRVKYSETPMAYHWTWPPKG